MAAVDRERHGQRVVDYFSAQPHRPYDQAETMEDVRSGLHVVRTLLRLRRFQQAADAYEGGLARALMFNLEAHADVLSLLRPFFPKGWDELPNNITPRDGGYIANNAALALDACNEPNAALAAHGVGLRADLVAEQWIETTSWLQNICDNLIGQNRLAQALRVDALALEVASISEDLESIFMSQLHLFAHQSLMGQWAAASVTWQLLDPMGRAWSRAAYRPGDAEERFARFQFWQGTLQEEHLSVATRLAAKAKNRTDIRNLHGLRGDWRLEQGEWAQAAESYQEAVRLARERGLRDVASETGLTLAKHHLGQLEDPRHEAERLAQPRQPAHRLLARLWLAVGDVAQAKRHALAAYKWAWADGEPYVWRYELTRTTELFRWMNVPVPVLPPYNPAMDEKLPWEDEVKAAVEKQRANKKGYDRREAKGVRKPRKGPQ